MMYHNQHNDGVDIYNLLSQSLSVVDIHMDKKYVTDSIGRSYMDWKKRHPVFIDAPTGTRKTTFIYDKIIPLAISKGQHVLLVSNRIALSSQQKQRILELVRKLAPESVTNFPNKISSPKIRKYTYIGPVCVATYQGLYSLLNTPNEDGQFPIEWYKRLNYAVFDEIHFLYSDALFNSYCGYLLKKLPTVFKSVIRIYMTATSWEIKDAIIDSERNVRNTGNSISLTPMESFISTKIGFTSEDYPIPPKFLYYHMDAAYSSYRLHFFGEGAANIESVCTISDIFDGLEDTLIQKMNPLPNESNKWLVFIDNKTKGQNLKKLLEQKRVSVAYIDAKQKDPQRAWNTLISQHTVEQSVLIATSVIQNGINIIDANTKNIAIFCIDRTAFIQQLGRKRLQEGETVDLWVWVPDWKYFAHLERKIRKHLYIAQNINSPDPTKYANGVRTLWDNREKLCYNSLFYVDDRGHFRVNLYTMEILKHQLSFIEQFTHQFHPWDFRDIVEKWLGVKAIESRSSSNRTTFSELKNLLQQNANTSLTEEEFHPIRQAIVFEILTRKLAYIRPDRISRLAPTSLNPLLSMLNLKFTVKKSKKIWTISHIHT